MNEEKREKENIKKMRRERGDAEMRKYEKSKKGIKVT